MNEKLVEVEEQTAPSFEQAEASPMNAELASVAKDGPLCVTDGMH